MRTLLIFNPAAGANRRDPRLTELLQAFVRRHATEAALSVTKHPGHATELAARAGAEGCALVVAVGGDGTVHEVATGLLGTATALGLVPRGSGNGLARQLRVPLDPARALAQCEDPTAETILIDSGTIAGRPFFNVAGCGFDADLARRFQTSRRRGLAGYVALGLEAWRQARPARYVIHLPDEQLSLSAQIVAFANSAHYGNGARIAPGAEVDDGRLDLVCLSPAGTLGALRLTVQLFTGRLRRSPDAVFRSGPEFLVEREAPGWIHTDGEPHWAPARLPVQVRARSLRVLRPAAAARLPAAHT